MTDPKLTMCWTIVATKKNVWCPRRPTCSRDGRGLCRQHAAEYDARRPDLLARASRVAWRLRGRP